MYVCEEEQEKSKSGGGDPCLMPQEKCHAVSPGTEILPWGCPTACEVKTFLDFIGT